IQGFTFSAQEWLYRSTIFAFMRGCGLVVQAEMHTNKGRADLVLNYKGQRWIIEIKVAYEGESPAAKAKEACRQIFEKNYNKPYPHAICVGLAIDDNAKQITEYKMIK
ncbi:MAG: PD-(D/E)XK nuclease domain-containing protein, partial [Dysgonamonadaceae bacterium]|nr:PD-(D/E)XK nuclease domain-containing protein [Dysgonamonadaceae bacterium]